MSEIEKSELTRKFIHNGIELPDISGMSVKDVQKVYAGQYPELTNSTFVYSGIENNQEIWKTAAKAGVKG